MITLIKKYLAHTVEATSAIQLSLPFGIWFGWTMGVSWTWWAASAFFATFVYLLVGNNVAMHRYFTHAHFTVSKPVELFFLWIGTMLGFGGPLSYALTHLVHHKYPDGEHDPHGPARGIRAWLVYFQKTVDINKTPVFSRQIVELNKKYRWIHEYYVPVVLANAAILWLIDFKVFLFLWLIPASAACWIVTISIWRQHLGLHANNSPIANWDILYEGLHKNHHDVPMAPNTALNPGEIDWTYQTAKLFGAKFNSKAQPKT
jgi:stearoyl-CoA desaturase (delta-9 desaturase)